MDKKVKVGIVSYLNTRPLIYGLKLLPISEQIELIEDNPARLADMLKNNEIDLGLIPVSAIPDIKKHWLIGDHCIGSDGETITVCLFSNVPLYEIEKIYLDYQSRTSAELLQWILKEVWKIHPELIAATNDEFRKEIKGKTAGLVIGDRAFEQRIQSKYFYDLGDIWKKATGLPFVFAAWVSNKPLSEEFIKTFNDANAAGLDQLDEIVSSNPFELFDLKKYYSTHISYHLDSEKRKGLEKFLSLIKTL